ncbi:MAG: hypothetical protein ABW123_24700 [Cystobacter sp.]
MQPMPQRPSLGRVVRYTCPTGCEHTADIVHVDDAAGLLTLHVKMTDPARPIQVEHVPFMEGVADSNGRSWRWPPRV